MILSALKPNFTPYSPLMRHPAAKFKALLHKSPKILVVTHWNPDGDALGSSLALSHFLKKMGHKVVVLVPNAFPDFLNWLPGSKAILNFEKQKDKALKYIQNCDLIFTLDFNTFSRLEELGQVLENCPAPKVLIDHHRQPEIKALLEFHDIKASSTCELIYDLILALKGKDLLDKRIAACLYTGLMTDTGSFKYSSVNAKTHQVVAALMETGIEPHLIHSAVYDNYSKQRLRLMGYALSEKLRFVEGLPVAYFCLNADELRRFGFQKGDTEGLVNYPFMIKGITVCALFSESEAGIVKISFRSKGKVDMNRYARKNFDGGGHLNASGGKSSLSLEQTEKKFLNTINELFR